MIGFALENQVREPGTKVFCSDGPNYLIVEKVVGEETYQIWFADLGSDGKAVKMVSATAKKDIGISIGETATKSSAEAFASFEPTKWTITSSTNGGKIFMDANGLILCFGAVGSITPNMPITPIVTAFKTVDKTKFISEFLLNSNIIVPMLGLKANANTENANVSLEKEPSLWNRKTISSGSFQLILKDNVLGLSIPPTNSTNSQAIISGTPSLWTQAATLQIVLYTTNDKMLKVDKNTDGTFTGVPVNVSTLLGMRFIFFPV